MLVCESDLLCCNSQVEDLFLASQLRLNGERLQKKSLQVDWFTVSSVAFMQVLIARVLLVGHRTCKSQVAGLSPISK